MTRLALVPVLTLFALGCALPGGESVADDGDEAGSGPDYAWELLIEGSATAVAVMADGDVVITGSREDDFWLARIDSETGEQIWSSTRDWAGGPDVGASVVVGGGPEGDAIYVVGTAWTSENASSSACEDPEEGCPQHYGIWIAEFDMDGELRWDQVYSPEPESFSEGAAVALASDGYPIVAGRLTPPGDGGAWIRRYGPEASIVWETVIPAYASVADIEVTAEDAVYVADQRQRRLHMLDADGALAWTVDTGHPGLAQIVLTPDGALAGVDALGGRHGLETDGSPTWSVPGPEGVWGTSIAVDAAGDLVIVGSILAGGPSDMRQVWAEGTDSSGTGTWGFQHWVGTPPPPQTDVTDIDRAMGVAFLPSGDLVVVGTAYDAQGTYAWAARWAAP